MNIKKVLLDFGLVISSQILWWVLIYVGFWIARGFVDDDDKKAGF